MRTMSTLNEDFSYLAGLIDGEGTITLSPPVNKKATGKSERRCPNITISNTDLELLEWVKARFGGSIIKKKVYQEHHKQSYVWRVTNRKATLLACVIAPFLKIERKRLRALQFEKIQDATNRGGQYTEESLLVRQRLEEEFFQL